MKTTLFFLQLLLSIMVSFGQETIQNSRNFRDREEVGYTAKSYHADNWVNVELYHNYSKAKENPIDAEVNVFISEKYIIVAFKNPNKVNNTKVSRSTVTIGNTKQNDKTKTGINSSFGKQIKYIILSTTPISDSIIIYKVKLDNKNYIIKLKPLTEDNILLELENYWLIPVLTSKGEVKMY